MFSFIKNRFKPKAINAALAWQKAGKETDGAFWLYAMPVHLLLQRDTFSLAEPAPLLLESHEIKLLTDTLNAHFKADGFEFFWLENTWFLSLPNDPKIDTKLPQLAINKDIRDFLPSGEGAQHWSSFTNEIQMLLFEHPVNLAREIAKKPVLNSLWCYGLGQIK